jgi:hypothetical protein
MSVIVGVVRVVCEDTRTVVCHTIARVFHN